MSDKLHQTRRNYLKLAGGAVGLSALSGCIGEFGMGGGEPIPIGSILPITGVLEDFGPGMESAVQMAVDEVNEAGGPLGRELDLVTRDSETRPEAGLDRYEELVTDHDIVGFVGAASSGVSAPVAENVADDQVMQVSPASTSPIFVDLGWDGDTKYFGRTAPNDGQQGVVMAWVLDEALGVNTASFLYVDNPYGEGLAEVARDNFSGETVSMVGYDQEASDFTSTLDSLFENDPEAVGFVGYPGEGRSILTQWDEGGYGGQWVLSEGLDSESFLEDMADIIDGFHLTSPDPEETAGRQHLIDNFPGELSGVFEEHSYDAVYLMAMSMAAGGEASGTAIAQNMQDVAIAPGEEVTAGEIDRAFDLLDDGEDITYIGASSPLEMNENLEALNPFAAMEITGGEKEVIEQFPVDYFEGTL